MSIQTLFGAQYNQTVESIKLLNMGQRSELLTKLEEWFDVDSDDVACGSSAIEIADMIWSFDPIISDGGIMEFCIANKLLN